MARDSQDIKYDLDAGTCVLGLEYGSTRIKAVLIDSANEPVAIGTFDWQNSFDGTYWTYPEKELLGGMQAAYASLKADVKARYGMTLRRIGAMGISAMMHGYLPFDAEGTLLVPFRTWRNTTAAQAARELSDLLRFHVPERWSVSHFYQAVLDGEAHVPHVSFLTTLAGYAHWRLTGKRVLSVGDASGMFPIDSLTRDYDAAMLDSLDRALAQRGVRQSFGDLLPEVLTAGSEAGRLSDAGAHLLDVGGDLEAGCPLCPPEGDAGTGMMATNSVAPRTGNVSAGTSVFSMVVLEHPLRDATLSQIDLVATPVGDPVAMIHCNNCTSDINDWVELLMDYSQTMGTPVDRDDVYTTLFNAALGADRDAGGLVSLPFVSGETVMGVRTGHPLFMRKRNARFTIANFMRMNVMAAFGALAVGHEALKAEDVRIDRLYAHGGMFKTPGVAQTILAAALDVPVTVMATAGEGGAWGQALAASYMLNGGEGESLADFLSRRVFSNMESVTIGPDADDVAGYRTFLKDFTKGNEVEKAAERHFA